MSTAHLSKYDGRWVFLSDRTNYWLIMKVIAVNNRGWCFLSPHTQWQVDQQKTLNWSSRYFGVLGLELKNKLLKANKHELRIDSRVGNFLFPCRSCFYGHRSKTGGVKSPYQVLCTQTGQVRFYRLRLTALHYEVTTTEQSRPVRKRKRHAGIENGLHFLNQSGHIPIFLPSGSCQWDVRCHY